jgi:hypothetical protein
LFMNATIYTGDGSQTASFTNGAAGASFQPDMVWSKIRTGTTQGTGVFDSVRGTTGQSLDTAATTAEGTWNGALSSEYGYVSAFNSNGFSVNDGSVATTGGYVNFSGRTYVAWQWKAGGTAVANAVGSIASSVSSNPTSGFSVVTYTGTGSSGSVGHGLLVGGTPTAPSMIFIKARTSGTGWRVYQANLGITKYLVLNSTADAGTASMWGTPTTTTFIIGGTTYEVNESGINYVAYCFAPVAGYSAFGTYTGNSTNFPFIYTGFRPKFVMVKASSFTTASTVWNIWDTSRSPSNAAVKELYPNSTDPEGTDSDGCDILSNGFKLRRSSDYANSNTQTYIYAAFAENPFKYANAR